MKTVTITELEYARLNALVEDADRLQGERLAEVEANYQKRIAALEREVGKYTGVGLKYEAEIDALKKTLAAAVHDIEEMLAGEAPCTMCKEQSNPFCVRGGAHCAAVRRWRGQ